MNQNPIRTPQIDPKFIFGHTIKSLKKQLPKQCTYLSSYKDSKGDYYVRAVINGSEYLFTIPPGFIFKAADVNELKSQILQICEQNVKEGDKGDI
jgi:hypothetical protein